DPNNRALLNVFLNGATPVTSLPLSAVDQLTVQGLAGDDTFTIDFTSGNPIPDEAWRFEGGSGTDTLVIDDHAGDGGTTYTVTGSTSSWLLAPMSHATISYPSPSAFDPPEHAALDGAVGGSTFDVKDTPAGVALTINSDSTDPHAVDTVNIG